MADESSTIHAVPPNGQSDKTEPAPICPNCKADPVMVMGRTFNMGPFTLLLTFCGACRHPIPSNILEIAKPRIATPKRSELIV